MRHAKIKNMLSEYLKNSLNDIERNTIKGHLTGCPACREELRILELYLDQAGDVKREKAPADFLFKVKARIAAKEKKNHWKRWLPLEALSTVAVATLVFFIVMPQKKADLPGKEKVQTPLVQKAPVAERKMSIKQDQIPETKKSEQIAVSSFSGGVGTVAENGKSVDYDDKVADAEVGQSEKMKKSVSPVLSKIRAEESIGYRMVSDEKESRRSVTKDSLRPAAAAEYAPSQEKMILSEMASQKGVMVSRTNNIYYIDLPAQNLPGLMAHLEKYGTSVKVETQKTNKTGETVRLKMVILFK